MEAPDRRAILAATAAAVAVSCIPHAWAALTAPAGSRFGWGVGFLPDTLGNLIFARQAASGSWLFADTYTAEPHPALFLHPLFLFVGWAQALTGLAPGLVLQFVRIAGAAALAAALIRAARRFAVPGTGFGRALAALALTGGGLGFLGAFVPAFRAAADVRGAEVTTFFSLYQQPHFVLALALLLWAVIHFLDAVETGSNRSLGLAATFHLLLASVHPYDIPVTCAAASLSVLLARRRPVPWRVLIVFLAAPAPLIAYDGWLSIFVPVYRDFAAEGLLAAPWPAADYALGYALLLPLAAAGIAGSVRGRDATWLLPVAWLLAAPALMALPLPARRKFIEGYHLMLCLLAARGWTVVAPRLGRLRLPVAAAGISVMCLSQFYVMARDVYAIDLSRRPERAAVRTEGDEMTFPLSRRVDRVFAPDPWMGGILSRGVDRYDLPADLREVLAWAAAHLDRSAVIMAEPSTGLLVPILTPHRVVAGHIFETLRLAEKEIAIRAVMDARLPDDGRRLLLERLGATAVLVDDRLLALGDWKAPASPWMATLASSGRAHLRSVDPMPGLDPARRLAAESEVTASLLALSGRDFMARRAWEDAVARLRQAADLRPSDPVIRAWLRTAEAGRSGKPAPRGTRNSG